ncbi:hypothetical protein [Pseudomonas brenneri]
MGSKETLSLSLKTTHRQSALVTASHLLTTLRAFHLDNPDATWADLKENLQAIATGVLQTRSVWDQLGDSGLVYAEVRQNLNEIARTEPLSVAQAQAVNYGRRLMTAAEMRTGGDLGPILGMIEELSATPALLSPTAAHTQPDLVPVSNKAITFKKLSDLYLEERKEDVKESSRGPKDIPLKTISKTQRGW